MSRQRERVKLTYNLKKVRKGFLSEKVRGDLTESYGPTKEYETAHELGLQGGGSLS